MKHILGLILLCCSSVVAAQGAIYNPANPVLATGSTTYRLLADRFATPSVDVRDFGAKFDGTTNDAAAIQAGINYVAGLSGGGILVLPCGVGSISSALTVTSSNIWIVGCGVGKSGLASPAGSTRILCGNAAATPMLSVGPSGSTPLSNNRVIGVLFDGNSSCATGLSVKSTNYSAFNVGYMEPTTAGVVVDTANITSNSAQFNDFWITGFCAANACVGLTLDSTGAPANGNASFNMIRYLDLQTLNGDCVHFNVSDNNIIEIARCFVRTTGTAKAVVFSGSNAAAGYAAQSNRVLHLSSNGASVARGTSSFTYPTLGNWVFLDQSNNTPTPTAETGAVLCLGGTFNSAVALGCINQATGTILNGTGHNVATTNYPLAAGLNNSSLGAESVAFGNNNAAFGQYSSILFGQQAFDNTRYATSCHSGGKITAAVGSAQTCETTLGGTGTSTTAIRLTGDNASAGSHNCVNIQNNAGFALQIDVVAFDRTTVTKSASWSTWTGLLTRGANAAATALTMNATPTPITNGAFVPTISAAADTTNGCLNLSVTPPALNTDTIDILAKISTIEVQ